MPLHLYGFRPATTRHHARCGSAASVRGVCGTKPSLYEGWTVLPREERRRLFERAEADLASEPGLAVYAAERRHGIPRGYLRRRLKAVRLRRLRFPGAPSAEAA